MKIFRKSDDMFAGAIIGVTGDYAGAIFRIDPDEEITIGRDPKTSQIVIDEHCDLVSRKHCTIKGNAHSAYYTVTDFSTNGTFVNDEKLPRGVTVSVARGSTIFIGNKENSFRLN